MRAYHRCINWRNDIKEKGFSLQFSHMHEQMHKLGDTTKEKGFVECRLTAHARNNNTSSSRKSLEMSLSSRLKRVRCGNNTAVRGLFWDRVLLASCRTEQKTGQKTKARYVCGISHPPHPEQRISHRLPSASFSS